MALDSVEANSPDAAARSTEILGFSIHEGILSDLDCDDIIAELQNGDLPRSRAGARHLMANLKIRTLALDSRLLSIVHLLLGCDAVPYRATLFEKTGRANWLVVWHQDTALPLENWIQSSEWGPWSMKAGVNYAHAPSWALNRILALLIHLDDSTPDNGPLKVLSGSHLQGVLEDEQVFELSRTGTIKECLVPRGGIVAMRPLLVHASSKAKTDKPRRVLHIEYADSLEMGDGIRLAVC